MALTVNTNIINDTDQYLLDAKNVKGGYIVVNSTVERDGLPAATIVTGSLCYCTADSKFYQYNGTAWVEKEFGTTAEATTSVAGLMSAGDKQKLSGIAAGAEVNVQSDWNETNTSSDAFIKNKPAIPADTNTTYDLAAPASKTNGNVTIDLTAGGSGSGTDSVKIKGSGATTVTTDASGVITISSTDNNTVYTHPTHTARDKKLYKVHVDGLGHIDDVTEVVKADITALGIPAQDTTQFTITANTSDDDIVILSGTNGTNAVTYSASHAKKGPSTTAVTTKGATADVVVTAGDGGKSIKVPKVTVDQYGHTTGLTEQTLSITIPATLKNPNALTIGGKSYDGSSAVSVTASDLGIANALHFIGETTTALIDGTTTAAVIISGASKTPVSGDVVLYGAKEFIWNGSAWKELGDGSSHALKTNTITAGNGLTGGGQIGNSPTLNVGAGNGITVSADAVAAKAGNGITVDSTGINHADTSSQASIVASGRKYITGVTLDTYGHVTGLTTGTETVTDTNQKVKVGNVTFGVSDEVNIVAGSNVSVTGNASAKTITIGADVSTLISSGTADPSASTASQYYFKYN